MFFFMFVMFAEYFSNFVFCRQFQPPLIGERHRTELTRTKYRGQQAKQVVRSIGDGTEYQSNGTSAIDLTDNSNVASVAPAIPPANNQNVAGAVPSENNRRPRSVSPVPPTHGATRPGGDDFTTLISSMLEVIHQPQRQPDQQPQQQLPSLAEMMANIRSARAMYAEAQATGDRRNLRIAEMLVRQAEHHIIQANPPSPNLSNDLQSSAN